MNVVMSPPFPLLEDGGWGVRAECEFCGIAILPNTVNEVAPLALTFDPEPKISKGETP